MIDWKENKQKKRLGTIIFITCKKKIRQEERFKVLRRFQYEL